MQSKTHLDETLTLDLTTPVLTSDGKSTEVQAVCEWYRVMSTSERNKSVRTGDRYRVYLVEKSTGKSIPGSMEVDILTHPLPTEYHKSMYRDDQEKMRPYLYVDYMRNTSNGQFRHIGNALHEAAFRLSVQAGFEGRVVLKAQKNTHYFHYINGFRQPDQEQYYFSVGKNPRANLGDAHLYLPSHSIAANVKKFHLSVDIPHSPTEDEKSRAQIQSGETIMQDASQQRLGFLTMLALDQPFGNRKDEPKISEDASPDEQFLASLDQTYENAHPGLFCQSTKKILGICAALIANNLPIDTAEKKEWLATIVCGTAICAMAFQDKTYGPQDLYGGVLLYPDKTMAELLGDTKRSIRDTILYVGQQALIEQSIPFDKETYATFLPALEGVMELDELIQPTKGPQPH